MEGKFRPYSGSIQNFYTDDNNKVHVTYTDKHAKKDVALEVERIIKCTGHNIKLQYSDNLLLRNLAVKGFIVADIFSLGIKTHKDDYSIIDAGNKHHPHIFTLGSNLRGKLWESIAVPELRVQAEETARQVLSSLEKMRTKYIAAMPV